MQHECSYKKKRDTERPCKDAKECQGLLATTRSVSEGFFPRDFRGSVATDTLISGFEIADREKNKFLLF